MSPKGNNNFHFPRACSNKTFTFQLSIFNFQSESTQKNIKLVFQ